MTSAKEQPESLVEGQGQECRACAAGLPMIWCVQSKKYMHEAQGLSVTPCAAHDARLRERGRRR